MRALWLLLAALTVPAAAQVSYPPGSVDTSTFATKADVQAAANTASAAVAAIPPACTKPPAQDSVSGGLGTGVACVHAQDASSATNVMPATAVTASDGTFSGTWPGKFTSGPTTVIAQAKTTADPYTCQVGAWTATTFSGKCWKGAQLVTLPSIATNLLGLVLTINTPAGAGIIVSVVGRQ